MSTDLLTYCRDTTASVVYLVCGHCLATLSLTINENIKMALIAAHLNAGVILVVTV